MAVEAAGDRLFLLHVTDSNRQAVERGQVDFAARLFQAYASVV